MQMSGMNPYHGAREARSIQPTFQMEPYLYHRLQQMEGLRVVVDTVRGSVNGVLVDAKPDHIVVQDSPRNPPFFVRLCEIVWIMPNID